jgi:hypothetical protein
MNSENYKYYCDKCNYGTDIYHSLQQHNKTILHNTGKRGNKTSENKIYKCNHCDYVSKEKNNYLTHQLNNHSTKEQREKNFKYYCKACDFGVFTESSMNIHLKTAKHKRFTGK